MRQLAYYYGFPTGFVQKYVSADPNLIVSPTINPTTGVTAINPNGSNGGSLNNNGSGLSGNATPGNIFLYGTIKSIPPTQSEVSLLNYNCSYVRQGTLYIPDGNSQYLCVAILSSLGAPTSFTLNGSTITMTETPNVQMTINQQSYTYNFFSTSVVESGTNLFLTFN